MKNKTHSSFDKNKFIENSVSHEHPLGMVVWFGGVSNINGVGYLEFNFL